MRIWPAAGGDESRESHLGRYDGSDAAGRQPGHECIGQQPSGVQEPTAWLPADLRGDTSIKFFTPLCGAVLAQQAGGVCAARRCILVPSAAAEGLTLRGAAWSSATQQRVNLATAGEEGDHKAITTGAG